MVEESSDTVFPRAEGQMLLLEDDEKAGLVRYAIRNKMIEP